MHQFFAAKLTTSMWHLSHSHVFLKYFRVILGYQIFLAFKIILKTFLLVALKSVISSDDDLVPNEYTTK